MCWYLSTRFGNVTSRYVFPLVTGCAIRWACSAAVIASLVKFSRCASGTPMQVNTRVRVAFTSSPSLPAADVRNRTFTVCACVSGVPVMHFFTSAFALARAAAAVGSAAIELAADPAWEDDEHPAAAGSASTAVIPAAVSMVLRFMMKPFFSWNEAVPRSTRPRMEAGATASGLGLRGGYLLSCSPLARPGKHPMGDPWLASTSLRHWATSWLTVGLPSAVYALALAALTFSFSVAMVALVYAVWILIRLASIEIL